MPTPESSTPPGRWPTYLAELKRRHVFRVAAVYGAVAFVVLQVADILVPALHLPGAVTTGVALIAIVGFPIALVLAWAFEGSPEGMRRTERADSAELAEIASKPRVHRWLPGLAALGGAALLVFGTWTVAGRVNAGGAAGASGNGEASLSQPLGSERGPGSPGGAGAPGTLVAVLPFAVQGSPEVAYLGPGMVSLLGTKLDGAGDLHSVDGRAVLQVLKRDGLDPDDAGAGRRIAAEFGAKLYVVGDIVQGGSRMQVSAALYEADRGGRPVVEGSVEGAEADMFGMVDDLATQLLSGLSGGPAARVQRIAGVTTHSLPALKAFLEGEDQFRRGQFSEAVSSFQRAVAEDSSFALAYYRLAIAGEWNLQDKLSRRAAEAAVRHADRLSQRDHRMLEAYLTRRRGDNLKAAAAYRSILGTHPDEMEAWLDLAEVQFHTYPLYGRSFTESRPTLEKVIEFDPNHSTALIHLARLAAFEGDTARVMELGARLLGLHPDPSRNLEIEALMAVASGDPDSLSALDADLREGSETGVVFAYFSAGYTENVEAMERIARFLVGPTRSAEAVILGHADLADFAATRGRWKAARAELAALARRSPGTALEQEISLANAPLSPVTRAELSELAARLERLDPASIETSDNPNIMFTRHDPIHPAIRAYELGLLRARLGKPEAALRQAGALEGMRLPPEAGSLGSDLAHGVRSEVYRAAGRLEDALAEIEAMPFEVWYDNALSSFAYGHPHERFARAELLFRLGRPDEAEPWYANFGPSSASDFPYLAAARLRLAQIAERRGDDAAAAKYRVEFGELWKGADAGAQASVDAFVREGIHEGVRRQERFRHPGSAIPSTSED